MGFLSIPRSVRFPACVLALAVFTLIAWARPLRSAQAQVSDPLLVIVAATIGGSDIRLGTLRQLYGGSITEYNGKRLIPFNQDLRTSQRQLFDRVVLDLAPSQVGPYWIDRKIRQGTDAPRTIPTQETLMRVVASLRGAVGYVQMSPQAVPTQLRVLSVDGIQPTDARYPLAAR